MIRKITYSFSFLFLLTSSFLAQDTATYLRYNDFLTIVKEHHPISFQANLTRQSGDMFVTKARGAFDPVIDGSINQKYFDGKNYYTYVNGGLKVPTWFGITGMVGYNNNDGTRLSNESYTPKEGLWNLGAEINLGQGLFIDQRRADLKQSKIIQNSTELEQKLMINNLLFEASVAYFEWYQAYQKVKVYEDALQNAEFRLVNIKKSADIGDKPFIDTLKAAIQFQDRALKLEANKLKLLNKRALLNTYLWQEGNIPLELKDDTQPFNYLQLNDSITADMINIDSLVDGHPELLMANNNIALSKVDYRLKRDKLKPKAKLKYNALAANRNGVFDEYTRDNYNWGASISYPIFTRKERGDAKLARIKLNQAKAKQLDKRAIVTYKVNSAINSKFNLTKQVSLSNKMVNSYNSLFEAELQLFNIGESSLFLVNTRDQNLIEARLKYLSIVFDKQLADATYKYMSFGF